MCPPSCCLQTTWPSAHQCKRKHTSPTFTTAFDFTFTCDRCIVDGVAALEHAPADARCCRLVFPPNQETRANRVKRRTAFRCRCCYCCCRRCRCRCRCKKRSAPQLDSSSKQRPSADGHTPATPPCLLQQLFSRAYPTYRIRSKSRAAGDRTSASCCRHTSFQGAERGNGRFLI